MLKFEFIHLGTTFYIPYLIDSGNKNVRNKDAFFLKIGLHICYTDLLSNG